MVMRAVSVFLSMVLLPSPLVADDCRELSESMRMPVKLKRRGKPSRARWEQIDKVLTGLREKAGGRVCALTFEQVFRTKREELLVPLTNNLLKTVPEQALQGLAVMDQKGEPLGEYVGRVTYEKTGGLVGRKSYVLYYFQFRDSEGQMQSTGNRLLLDYFLVRWADLKGRVAIDTRAGS